MTRVKFKIEGTAPGTRARAGRVQTRRGEIETPVFMPVGTQATVKGVSADNLKAAGSRMLLANTYHLMLRPGVEVFDKFGGIHRFMNWDGSVLTDSGGFQIFSLPQSRKITEAGAEFQSYVDGKLHLLSPEESIRIQSSIGSDIMMVLDQCIPSTSTHTMAREAMELTHRWAKRSYATRSSDSQQGLFGIVQGACYPDLRKESADTLMEIPFDGYAIGGLAVGESKAEREDFTEIVTGYLPESHPRYLMGVGTPLDILEAVHRGVDMFDCIIPTALGRQGIAFTSRGRIQLRRSVYKYSDDAVDAACDCGTCRQYSRAYLHHLTKADELVGWKLLSRHNLRFYHDLTRQMRAAIFAGTFTEFHREWRQLLSQTDIDNPVCPPRRGKSKAKAITPQAPEPEVG